MSNRFQAGLKGVKDLGGKNPGGSNPGVKAPATRVRTPAAPPAEPAVATATAGAVPSRKGKVVISAYFDPAVRQQLAILAIRQERSQAALLADALNLLFEAHGEAPIARA